MSLHLETNKWTPKLIIVFQLTIWSIVGIILLQKGVISLREKTKSRNDTADVQEKLTRWNREESIRNSPNIIENRRHVTKVHHTGTQQMNVNDDQVDDVTLNERLPCKLHSSCQTHNIDQETIQKVSIIKKQATTVRIEHDIRGTRAAQALTIHANKKNEVKSINHKENIIVSLASNGSPYDTEKTSINNITERALFELKGSGFVNYTRPGGKNSFEHEVDDAISYEITGNGKSETKPRRTPVNRIGAAIAIIMLAIGIVMLLLGPCIVILRALTNRRRTREILHKKRNRTDRPPTYEEATLMDQAPRYSTLQLDTILESSFSD